MTGHGTARQAWREVAAIARALTTPKRWTTKELQEMGHQLAQCVADQMEHYGKNPSLVIYGNPPIGVRRHVRHAGTGTGPAFDVLDQIASDVHQIKYQHAEDGQDYQHRFDGGAQMYAIVRNGLHDLLLTEVDGAPLWGDFPA